MPKKDEYPKYYKCRWCGVEMVLERPWHGRPEGPRCQCNPDSWGNWQRIQATEKT
jgi:hypothetical protein